MASLAEFARVHTRLDAPEIDHLQRLVASWGLLADLCFADLLLFAGDQPDARRRVPASGPDLVVLGQVRPLTNQTLYRSDWVGTVVPRRRAPARGPLRSSWARSSTARSPTTSLKERVRALCIPVRWQGRTDRRAQPGVGARRCAIPASSSAPTSRCSTASPG